MASMDKVRKAAPDDLPEISGALSRAFFTDPLFAWALPDADRRQRLLPEFFALFARAFLRHDQSYTTAGDVVAAALWAPPGAVPVSGEDAEELGRQIEELAGPDALRFLGSTSCSMITTHTGPTGTCSSWEWRRAGRAGASALP